MIAKFRKGQTTQDLTKQTVFHVAKTRAMPSWEQWKHVPHLLTATERLIGRIALVLVIVSSLTLIGRYLLLNQTIVPAVGGEYTEGLIGMPQFVNPLYAVTSDVDNDLTRLVFSGLMKYEPGVGLVGDLAESYDLSDDGKTYTFVLRDGARWHDGNPVRIADIIATFSMMQSPEYKSPLSVTFSDISIEQVDERTVQFMLTEPFAPFLSALTVGIMPSHIWATIPARSAP
ncbi:MAG: ABC transporter substrate-binding protein, partial [Patescibacteria group bacterium]